MNLLLRECRDCGLKAHSSADLDNFVKDSNSKHGRQNLCNQCRQIRRQEKKQHDDQYCLQLILQGMKTRCYNPNASDYHYYGNRGVTICQEWLENTDAFIGWSLTHGWGRGLEIDRIDNDDIYTPDNCRWTTRHQQMRNTRINVTDFEKGTRVCNKCGIKKPLKEFHRNKSMTGGRAYICKPCWNKFDRERYREEYK